MPSDLPLDPTLYSPRFAQAAQGAGFRAESFGEVRGHSLMAYTRRTTGIRPRVYLSSGIHGDEPAPPLALFQLMAEGCFDDRCTWFICPLLNPTGIGAGTRENFAGTDLNRDYKSLASSEVRTHVGWLQRQPRFDLTICLHEDWEAAGFYIYELNPLDRPTLAHAMIAAARTLGPIETAAVIDGREAAEPGIIRPLSDPLLRDTWPEALYISGHHCSLNYTIETVSTQPLEQRINTHKTVLRAALSRFRR